MGIEAKAHAHRLANLALWLCLSQNEGVSSKPQTQPVSSLADGDEPLSVAQAAQLVGVSEQALRKRIRKGTLPAHKLQRGNQVVTVLSRAELEEAYPEIAAGDEGADATSRAARSAAQERGLGRRDSSELVVRLREDLATAAAARLAAEGRCEAAEERASRAEEKLERALVHRGDEIAQTRKEAERQSMQMAMEIARAQLQLALPEAPETAVLTQRRWFGGLAVGALVIAAGALFWGIRAWNDLSEARAQEQGLSSRIVELQGRTTDALERAVDAEGAHREARDEVHRAQQLISEERESWEQQQALLQAEIEREREARAALREELVRAYVLRRAEVNLVRTAAWLSGTLGR